jgi:hypothetical protein
MLSHFASLIFSPERQVRLDRGPVEDAKAKPDTLNKAEGASWAAMKSALTETRAALDRAHRAVLEGFERTAGDT